MLARIFSRRVFIHVSLHESVAGNRDAQSRNDFFNIMLIIYSLQSVGMEGTRGYG